MIYFNNICTIFLTQITKVDSNTVDDKSKDNGIIGNWFNDLFKEQVVEFATWIVTSLLNFLEPIVTWGCKLVIVWCVVSFYCTKDDKNLSLGMKSFLIYLIFVMIKGALT